MIALLLVITLLAPIGLLIFRKAAGWGRAQAQLQDGSPLPLAVTLDTSGENETRSVRQGQAEHVHVHLGHLIDKHRKMSESIRRAQDLVRQVAPYLERNFLQQQKRRLESADFHMESVRREIEESLEELEMMMDLERSN
jgi:hypothetical protein